ncbi:hypothetical protein PRIPAC_82820 [Pristionchus pacificus]|uniref:Hydrolase n=1 Tax=Pristionchus pacificus TaxID=54126 RepID=A0A2A6C418_PRIPA|nr:hypothetical protein PRIPAC_82820 [Pristionchus pacificus]|eukprot:PDM72869.1 hydrolase [Pristionchus pacificus]
MAPGVVGGASQFFLNPPESSPAFILADAGIDVFLLNYRGTTYGKRHITLQPRNNKFWQFTLDELAKYDAPAAINKVLAVTGKKSLYWIGHSQGTAVGFMTLADNPKYNRKVKALFQLGPAGTSGYAKGMMRFAFLAFKNIKPLVDLYRIALGSHEIIFGQDSVYISLCEFSPFNVSGVCEHGIYSLFDSLTISLNATQESELFADEHSGTSTWILLHWAQMAARQTVEHMDHNPIINLVRYGQETPPPYNYTNINVPVYLFWSKDDWMTTAEEIEHIILKMLRKEIVKGGREIPRYSHADFIEATDCADMVFNPISEIIRKQEIGMCDLYE